MRGQCLPSRLERGNPFLYVGMMSDPGTQYARVIDVDWHQWMSWVITIVPTKLPYCGRCWWTSREDEMNLPQPLCKKKKKKMCPSPRLRRLPPLNQWWKDGRNWWRDSITTTHVLQNFHSYCSAGAIQNINHLLKLVNRDGLLSSIAPWRWRGFSSTLIAK